MKTSIKTAAIALLLLLAIGFAHAALPPLAQQAMKQGLGAAKAKDFIRAIQYFEEGRVVAPAAPDFLYNLGLAESKIPGRELRAITWFGAYLAANPHASNAAAVKNQVALLIPKSLRTIDVLVKLYQDTTKDSGLSQETKDTFLENVSGFWIQLDDLTKAMDYADHMAKDRDRLLDQIVPLQIKRGDLEGALKTAARMEYPGPKRKAYNDIAVAQAIAGDREAGYRTLDLVSEQDVKEYFKKNFDRSIGESKSASVKPPLDVSTAAWIKLFGTADADYPTLNQRYMADVAAWVKSKPTSMARGRHPDEEDPALAFLETFQTAIENRIYLHNQIIGMFKALMARHASPSAMGYPVRQVAPSSGRF